MLDACRSAYWQTNSPGTHCWFIDAHHDFATCSECDARIDFNSRIKNDMVFALTNSRANRTGCRVERARRAFDKANAIPEAQKANPFPFANWTVPILRRSQSVIQTGGA